MLRDGNKTACKRNKENPVHDVMECYFVRTVGGFVPEAKRLPPLDWSRHLCRGNSIKRVRTELERDYAAANLPRDETTQKPSIGPDEKENSIMCKTIRK